jgi:hypothetical protein
LAFAPSLDCNASIEDIPVNFTRLTRAATFVVASATLAHCVSGQSPTVLRDDNGSLVEFVGLKRWSLAMVVDSARKYAPKEKLTAHVCAEMFREQLRFPDAASFLFAGTPERWLVIVREPADSSRVRFRTVGSDTTNPSQALNYLGSGAQSNGPPSRRRFAAVCGGDGS